MYSVYCFIVDSVAQSNVNVFHYTTKNCPIIAWQTYEVLHFFMDVKVTFKYGFFEQILMDCQKWHILTIKPDCQGKLPFDPNWGKWFPKIVNWKPIKNLSFKTLCRLIYASGLLRSRGFLWSQEKSLDPIRLTQLFLSIL